MIEATCTACGTRNRVPDASVPAGARFITCVDCKARVALPLPPSPGTLPKLSQTLPQLPPTAVPPTTKPTSDLDVADLPAPKRPTSLGIGPPQPASRTSTASKLPLHTGLTQPLVHELDPELPAPKITRTGGPSTASRIELGDLGNSAALMTNEGGIDLPAPKRNTQRLGP